MKKIYTLLTLLSISFAAFSQNQMELEDSTGIKASSFDQQYDYENLQEPFPPKKRNNWTFGFSGGAAGLLSDVRPLWTSSYGASINVRKSFSHVFSMRLQSIYADMKGVNYRSHNVGGEPFYLNYNTRMTDHTLQAVFSLNNVNFHKRYPKVVFNVFAGIGAATSFTRTNLYDENGNSYDYSGLANIETYGDRRFVVNQLLELMDDGFETVIEPDAGDPAINDTRIMPSVVFGSGLDFRLSKRVDLSLETRISKHYTDMLDGFERGDGDDWMIYSSIGLNFKLGKKGEPLYWVNPLNEPYSDIMELKSASDPMANLVDLDQDGVWDYMDRDPNTPFGAAVTVTGEALDSDKDGVPDYRDREVYSVLGSPVDALGFAIDSDGDGIPDVKDAEANTPQTALVDVNGRSITPGGSATVSSPAPSNGVNNVYAIGSDLWSIFFDTDDSKVKSDYDVVILNLASYMIANPSAQVLLTGYADSRSSADYNLNLSKKRAQSVLAKFTQLGIDQGRFIIEYKGESALLVQETSDLTEQLNRRVTLQLR